MDILLIEDDQIEILKFKKVAHSHEVAHCIEVAENGEMAMTWLQETKRLPDIILLDLNMPKMSGLEFLSLLKSDAKLRYLPTVILTTSINRKDVTSCYEAGIAGYLLKPLKYEDYVRKIKHLLNYWNDNELIKP